MTSSSVWIIYFNSLLAGLPASTLPSPTVYHPHRSQCILVSMSVRPWLCSLQWLSTSIRIQAKDPTMPYGALNSCDLPELSQAHPLWLPCHSSNSVCPRPLYLLFLLPGLLFPRFTQLLPSCPPRLLQNDRYQEAFAGNLT